MAIKLIAGLGNPGRKHARDRHNAGFWFAERLAARERASFRAEPRYHADTARLAGEIWLVMPQTYMNLSGKAVGALARFYKIQPDEVLVAHDELDFPPGTVRLKLGGGVAGHNGLKDIAVQLGTQGFWRLRIGIGHPGDKDLVADYVLNSPSPDDRALIDESIERGLEVSPLILAGDLQAATMKLHTRKKPPPDEPATGAAP
ncbi:MAG: aminoacyl-tRNA hydrolase [Burkholderiales bacterium]